MSLRMFVFYEMTDRSLRREETSGGSMLSFTQRNGRIQTRHGVPTLASTKKEQCWICFLRLKITVGWPREGDERWLFKQRTGSGVHSLDLGYFIYDVDIFGKPEIGRLECRDTVRSAEGRRFVEGKRRRLRCSPFLDRSVGNLEFEK